MVDDGQTGGLAVERQAFALGFQEAKIHPSSERLIYKDPNVQEKDMPTVKQSDHSFTVDLSDYAYARVINWDKLQVKPNKKMSLYELHESIFSFLDSLDKINWCAANKRCMIPNAKDGGCCGVKAVYVSDDGICLCDECKNVYWKKGWHLTKLK